MNALQISSCGKMASCEKRLKLRKRNFLIFDHILYHRHWLINFFRICLCNETKLKNKGELIVNKKVRRKKYFFFQTEYGNVFV